MSEHRALITLYWSTAGVGYSILVDALAAFLSSSGGARARAELADELRSLARKLEAGESPFSSYVEPNLHESRGSAEREIDRLAAHILKLQERGA